MMAGTGRTVPSLRAVAESAAFLDPNQKPAHSQVFLDVIPALRRLPNLPKWPSIEETASNEIERAFYGQATVEEAAATAIDADADLLPEVSMRLKRRRDQSTNPVQPPGFAD